MESDACCSGSINMIIAQEQRLHLYNVTDKRCNGTHKYILLQKTYYYFIFQYKVYNKKPTARKEKSNLSPNKIKINNILNKNIVVIANSFNKYFVNIGPDLGSNIKNPTSNSSMEFLNNPTSSRFSFEPVYENTVYKTFDNLSAKKNCGIDELSTHLKKSIKFEILGPLTIKINQSLVTGIFPD